MNKKIFKSLFMGALLVGSVGTLTSCSKDYDNDINSLKTEIAKLETLSTSVTALQTSLATVQTTANNAATAAKAAADAAAAAQKTADAAATKAALTDLSNQVATINTALAGKADKDSLTKYVNNLAALGMDVTKLKASLADYATKADLDKAIKDFEAGLAAGKTYTDNIAAAIEAKIEPVASLKASVDQLVTDVETLKSDNTKIQERLGTLESQYTALKGASDQLVGEVDKMVTDVDIQVQGDDYNNASNAALRFNTVTEQDNTFGPDGQTYATFKNGNIVTYGDSIMIRVSPTTAQLTPDMISLLNSKGEELTVNGNNGFVEVTDVQPYKGLLTRADANTTGLWKVYFNLKKGYVPEDLAKAVTTTNEYGYVQNVAFCVAVKSKLTGGGDRRVISSYDVTVGGTVALNSGKLDFTASNRDVNHIRNRYYTSEFGTTETNKNIEAQKDYIWANDGVNQKPAVTPITSGADINVIAKAAQAVGNDNRDMNQGFSLLPVVKGQQIPISINTTKKFAYTNNGQTYYRYEEVPIAGFYVALDVRNAVESKTSEINAWKSYSYSNVYVDATHTTNSVYQKGNTGYITVNDMNNVSGDIIGFRVYAVNLDGTLVDPDGRAFYVSVGNQATSSEFSTNLTTFNLNTNGSVANGQSPKLNSGDLSDLSDATNVYVTRDDNNPKINNANAPLFAVEFLDKDGNKLLDVTSTPQNLNMASIDPAKITSVQVTMSDLASYIDNATYTQNYAFVNSIGGVVRNIKVSVKKTLPTTAPANSTYSAKGGQMEEGTWRAFLTPNESAKDATEGTIQLNNAFNGLYTNDSPSKLKDPNFTFEFTDADKDADGNLIPLDVTSTYGLTVANGFIDNETSHLTNVYYSYKGISTTLKTDGTAKTGDVNIKVDTFNTIFCCYMYNGTVGKPVQSFDWTTASKAAAGKLVYGVENSSLKTSDIQGTNKVSSDYTTTLDKLFGKIGSYIPLMLTNVEGVKKATLTTNSNGIVDEYFTVSVGEGGVITFSPAPGKTGEESKPKTTVPSTLTINCLDWYGHSVVITCQMTINPNPVK